MILLYENAFSLIIYMFSTATILRLMENNTLIVIHDVYTVVCFVILWWTAIFESIVCLAGAILNGSPIVPITAQTRFFNYQLRSNLTIYLKRCITPIGRGMGTICLNRRRQNTKRHRQPAALQERNGIFLITICIKIKTNGNVWGKKRKAIPGAAGLSNVLLIRPQLKKTQEMGHRRTHVFSRSCWFLIPSSHLSS